MAGDAQYDKVSLLLHGNGTNGSTTITDNSLVAKTMTANGDAQISTAQSKFGGASLLLDGTNDYVSTPHSAEFDFPGDFTIETFFRFTGYTSAYGGLYGACLVAHYLGGGANTGWQVRINGTSSTYDSINLYTGLTDLNVTGLSFSLNTWYHIAISRSGSTIRYFVDGALVATHTNSDNMTRSTGTSLRVGMTDDATYKFFAPAYIDEMRITKGHARYTAAFTVPAAAFPDGMGQVSGTVTDETGAACARTVRAYRRDTGALVVSTTSDAGTGAYSMYTPTLDEVTVLALDDAVSGTIYNDIVERVIPA